MQLDLAGSATPVTPSRIDPVGITCTDVTVHQAIEDDGIKDGVQINAARIAIISNRIKWRVELVGSRFGWILKNMGIQIGLSSGEPRRYLGKIQDSMEIC